MKVVWSIYVSSVAGCRQRGWSMPSASCYAAFIQSPSASKNISNFLSLAQAHKHPSNRLTHSHNYLSQFPWLLKEFFKGALKCSSQSPTIHIKEESEFEHVSCKHWAGKMFLRPGKTTYKLSHNALVILIYNIHY